MDTLFPRNTGVTYQKYFERHRRRLRKALIKNGVDRRVADAVERSAYELMPFELNAWGVGPKEPVVHDGLYDTKWGMGYIPLSFFASYLKKEIKEDINKLRSKRAPHYEVSSIKEIEDILSTKRHKSNFESGRTTFRGQTNEYFINRPIPSPLMRYSDGEKSILPGFWRKHLNNLGLRPLLDDPEPLLSSPNFQARFYFDLPNWQQKLESIFSRYPEIKYWANYQHMRLWQSPSGPQGPAISYGAEMEKGWLFHAAFGDWGGLTPFFEQVELASDEQIVLRRWFEFEGAMKISSTAGLVEQHYGFDTCGLDLTFDIATAAFFATNRFVWENEARGTANYIQGRGAKPLIYAFVFEDPPLERSDALVTDSKVMARYEALRPMRQSCTLIHNHSWQINVAAADLDAVFYLKPDFSMERVRAKELLFPRPDEDQMYKILLELKSDGNPIFNSVPEYTF